MPTIEGIRAREKAERWKDIDGYDGKYQISNLGNVKSLKTYHGDSSPRILTPVLDKYGYYKFVLKHNRKSVTRKVHRLVAEAFILNPNNKPCVNHIDGNKSNNCVENLEWVTYAENEKHAYNTGLVNTLSTSKPVLQCDPKSGEIICWYPSTMEAQRVTGINNSQISKTCLGKGKIAGNYKWKYCARNEDAR